MLFTRRGAVGLEGSRSLSAVVRDGFSVFREFRELRCGNLWHVIRYLRHVMDEVDERETSS